MPGREACRNEADRGLLRILSSLVPSSIGACTHRVWQRLRSMLNLHILTQNFIACRVRPLQ